MLPFATSTITATVPSRWWLPIHGIHAAGVRPEHVHAVVSRWFDKTTGEHRAQAKPYAVSPLADSPHGTGLGCEVGVLTDAARDRLIDGATVAGRVRLGSSYAEVGDPAPLHEESWKSLAVPSGARAWTLEFVTPVTFRQGSRSTPLPTPASVLRGLAESWAVFSPSDPLIIPRERADALWISDLRGETHSLRIAQMHLRGFLGRVTLQCDAADIARTADCLLRLAPYAGIGTARAKGLGVTRVVCGSAGGAYE